MKNFLKVVKDSPCEELLYIKYNELPANTYVKHTETHGDDILIDYDNSNNVLGIELLSLAPENLARVREIAHNKDLVFPTDNELKKKNLSR